MTTHLDGKELEKQLVNNLVQSKLELANDPNVQQTLAIAEKTAVLQSGVTQINDGQKQLLGVLNDLQNQMGKLESGLSTSSEGLDKVSGGLKDAQKFLSDFSKSKTTERFYIPQKIPDDAV
jgi:RND superfamily putative drug exporter